MVLRPTRHVCATSCLAFRGGYERKPPTTGHRSKKGLAKNASPFSRESFSTLVQKITLSPNQIWREPPLVNRGSPNPVPSNCKPASSRNGSILLKFG